MLVRYNRSPESEIMTTEQKRIYLIKYLLSEGNLQADIPPDETAQKQLLRALFNVRMPQKASDEFLQIQNQYLQEELSNKGITDVENLLPVAGKIYLWKGDITTLKCDAIVNAANSAMLGCFRPLHNCIDNAIHTAAGVELRLECDKIMQGRQAQNAQVVVTSAYNLPSKYVFHTVGPIVSGAVTKQNRTDLANCYLNCLETADKMHLTSIAFCCISTGVFGYPKQQAAALAVKTVSDYLQQNKSDLKVVFNVFTEEDYAIYNRIFSKNFQN